MKLIVSSRETIRSQLARLLSWLGRSSRSLPVVLGTTIPALLTLWCVYVLLFASLKPVGFAQIRDTFDLFAKIFGGLLVMVGLLFTYRRLVASEKVAQATLITAKAELDSRITDRFSRAIDQLGSEKLEIRLGGIYSLERIARDSDRDYWTVMSVLSAFVREHSPNAKSKKPEESQLPLWPSDVTAAAAVLDRRGRRPESLGLNLGNVDLSRMHFHGAGLEKSLVSYSNLSYCDLKSAVCKGGDFTGAILSFAKLTDADLTGSCFLNAHLDNAELMRATLIKTILCDANLRNANLSFADLTQANLCGADMAGAKLVCSNLPVDCLLIKSFARADLRGVDLSGRDLRYVDLRGADLRGANLAGAQLPSDLSGTIVSGESTRDLSQFLTRKELWGKIGDEFGLMAFLALTTQQQEILFEVSQLDALNFSRRDETINP
jgi:uncharacterized protein YjbI with pentapeptide repeats